MRAEIVQSNFTAGELSPRLFGRTDVKKYFNGAARLLNTVVHPHGGSTRRPGTYFAAETKDSSKMSRLIPFEFSTVQAYILEFGDKYIRWYRDQGQLLSGSDPLEIVSPWTEDQLRDLRFVQSADILYLFHPDVRPKQLNRLGDTNWTITNYDFQDGPYLPEKADVTVTPSGTSGNVTLTASGDLFVSTDVGRLIRLKHGTTWSWLEITGYTSATQVSATVKNQTTTASASDSYRLGAWSDTTGWPYCGTFFEERLILGGNDNQPNQIWGSVAGDFINHQPSNLNGTVADDDGVSFAIYDDRVNAIRWMQASKDGLQVGTQGGEWIIRGSNGPLSPSDIEAVRQTNHGSSADVIAKRVGHSTLFVQRSGRKIRELTYNFDVDGYVAPDLSQLAEHITSRGVVDMDYQQEPDSILWSVRDDGFLIGMTFEKPQEVVGWHGHDIGGVYEDSLAIVESIAVIPDPTGTYDELWMIVLRTINGETKRYVEFLTKQFDGDTALEDAFFVDCGLTYNGYQVPTLTVSDSAVGSGRTFTTDDDAFAASDVGKQIWAGTGRAIITAFSSATEVTATIHKEFEDTTIGPGQWAIAVNRLEGADHLIGQEVQILGDGASHPNRTVDEEGGIDLARYVAKAHLGLGYITRIKGLPLEDEGGGKIRARNKRVVKTEILFHNTVHAKYGPSDDNLETIYFRSGGDPLGTAVPLFSGTKSVDYPNGWEKPGEVVVIQDLPLPLTVLSFIHTIEIGKV